MVVMRQATRALAPGGASEGWSRARHPGLRLPASLLCALSGPRWPVLRDSRALERTDRTCVRWMRYNSAVARGRR